MTDVFQLAAWTDETVPDGNGPTLADCARFLLSGDPDSDWPGAGPLAEPGTTHDVWHFRVTYLKLGLKDGRPHVFGPVPDHSFVALTHAEGGGWFAEDVFESLQDLLDSSEAAVALFVACVAEGDRGGPHLFQIENKTPTLTRIPAPKGDTT
ncbi:hypothetical protein [Litorimonas sp. WD9-15]|uniref:hypothetical protein n=1 Tax=Litorimonas sp. WD9-15 TaxID=3418716 RepID=UPI003D02A50F